MSLNIIFMSTEILIDKRAAYNDLQVVLKTQTQYDVTLTIRAIRETAAGGGGTGLLCCHTLTPAG